MSLQAAINGTSESVGLMQAAGSVADGLASLKDGVNSASAGSIRYLNSALQTLQALRDAEEDESKQQTYDTLIGYIQNSIGIQQNIAVPEELVAGANGVYGGLSQISASIAGSGTSENPGLAAGAKSIRDGIGQLDSGLDAATADSGSLTSSARELAAGAAQLSEGQTAVSSGAKELAAGMESLENASGQLIGGIGQLDKGAVELSTGMKQFYSQGIQKLVQLYNSDLKGITENVDSVIKAGKQYKSFTQLPESMDGNVKFIYKTEITE